MTISETSLRDRVKNLAQNQNRSVNEILKQLYLERFLARLSCSNYNDKFIFKGGNLLSYFIELGRETKDLDFMVTNISAQESVIEIAFKAIARIVLDDGFVFNYVGLRKLEQAHMIYPGFRASLGIHFMNGTLKDVIQVDLGVGDVVNPETQALALLQYKDKPFFEASLSLLVYPIETIFAEKLETVISKGSLNSRMKDYHDLLLMCREIGLMDMGRMVSDINATFKHRGTPREFPINYSNDNYERLELHWTRHLRGLGDFAQTLKLPVRLEHVVLEVNDFLKQNGVF